MKHATEELCAIAVKEGFSHVFNVKFTEKGVPLSARRLPLAMPTIKNDKKRS